MELKSPQVWRYIVILRNKLKFKGIKTVIPRKFNERMTSDGRSGLDRETYLNRNVVERSFGRMKEYRRIATPYDKTARNYLATVKLDCIRLFYSRLCNQGTQPSINTITYLSDISCMKSLSFSKSVELHDKVIGQYLTINHYQ